MQDIEMEMGMGMGTVTPNASVHGSGCTHTRVFACV